ncbi:MAG: hypothetical protein HOB49_12950, partial [Gemmatimonadetes bacterium]|nr:hypothetical protein [Gemmatimonadota bacterium]
MSIAASDEEEEPASKATVARLSGMFWLAQMSDAASLVLLSGYMADMGFSGTQISSVYATMALAALVSPFLAGWLADRFFPSQIMLGICYVLTAPILVAAWQQTTFRGFWLCIAGVSLLRMPARTLSNVVAFHHLRDRTRIGQVRVWGTLG